jgi:hypothetical protein
MQKDLPSTGDTQAVAAVQPQPPHGFVESCITLIENLLDPQSLPALEPEPSEDGH